MTKVVIAAILAAVIIGGSTFFVLNGNDEEAVDTQQNAQTSQNDMQPEPKEEVAQVAKQKGAYVAYESGQQLASTEESQTIVFFHADWCQTCRFYEKEINEKGVPDGITIIKADYDKETDLKSKYGVSVQSTFVLLDREGAVAKSWPFARGLDGITTLYQEVAAL